MTTEFSEYNKFAADRMLGRLARWLRVNGQDVIYGGHLSGYGLVRAARQDGRLILTRDRSLGKKSPPCCLFIESDHFRAQLRQVVEACRLEPARNAFTRCVGCNTPLEAIAKAGVEGKVPPYVFATQERFSFCRKCQHIYWPATHQQKMLEELNALGLKSPGI